MGRIKIAFLVNQLISKYTMDLVRGATTAAADLDVDLYIFSPSLLIANADNRQNMSDMLRNVLYFYAAQLKLDGYVLATDGIRQSLGQERFAALLEALKDTNSIFLENELPGRRCLISDQAGTTRELVRHLIETHHMTRIGALRGPADSEDANLRFGVIRQTIEEAGLPFDESYVRTGDFDDASGALIRELLEEHPELEAVVCGNDFMAVGACRTLREMGLEPGRDVAVVGYDNVEDATRCTPPLTTVATDIYAMGYEGVCEAVRMACGKPQKLAKVPTRMCLRGSCGCGAIDWNIYEDEGSVQRFMPFTEEKLPLVAGELYDHIKGRAPSEARSEEGVALIASGLAFVYRCALEPASVEVSTRRLGDFLERLHRSKISVGLFQEELVTFSTLLARQIGDIRVLAGFNEKRFQILSAITFWQERQIDKVLSGLSEDMFKTLSIPDSVIAEGQNQQRFLETISETLRQVGVRDCELFCFPAPEPLYDREKRYLVADTAFELLRIMDGQTTIFEQREATALDRLLGTCCENRQTGMTRLVFALQHDRDQFGLLMPRYSSGNYVSLFLAAYQIGSAMKSRMQELSHLEMEEQLQHAVRTISEKNEILEQASLYDPLTQVLNRRGLIRNMKQLVRENQGRQGIILFLDMDNLKQINDQFGHNAGDYAIKSFARTLTGTLRKGDVVGRFGGDEFLALVVDQGGLALERLPDRIRESFRRFNETSSVEYYVEASIGFTTFTCREEPDLEFLFDHADTFLYLDKQNKRRVVAKAG